MSVSKDYALTIERYKAFGHAFLEIRDLHGHPFFLVEAKPGKCPFGGAEKFYAWGLKFNANGTFLYFWGEPPLLCA